jgi:flagellar motor switch protein FliN/FliY
MDPTEDKAVNASDTPVAVGEETSAEAPPAEEAPAGEASAEEAKAEEATVAEEKPPAEEKADEQKDTVKKADFQPLTDSGKKSSDANTGLLYDVVVPVSVELARTSMSVKEVLVVGQGSVIELDRMAGEPVEILVSGKVLGRGEVVVVNDRFGVRITELIDPIGGKTKE